METETLTMIVHPAPGACVPVGEHEMKLEPPERFPEEFAQGSEREEVFDVVGHQGAFRVEGAELVPVTPEGKRALERLVHQQTR